MIIAFLLVAVPDGLRILSFGTNRTIGCGPQHIGLMQEVMVDLIGDHIQVDISRDPKTCLFDPEEGLQSLFKRFDYLLYLPEPNGSFTLGTLGPDQIAGTEDDYFRRWGPN